MTSPLAVATAEFIGYETVIRQALTACALTLETDPHTIWDVEDLLATGIDAVWAQLHHADPPGHISAWLTHEAAFRLITSTGTALLGTTDPRIPTLLDALTTHGNPDLARRLHRAATIPAQPGNPNPRPIPAQRTSRARRTGPCPCACTRPCGCGHAGCTAR